MNFSEKIMIFPALPETKTIYNTSSYTYYIPSKAVMLIIPHQLHLKHHLKAKCRAPACLRVPCPSPMSNCYEFVRCSKNDEFILAADCVFEVLFPMWNDLSHIINGKQMLCCWNFCFIQVLKSQKGAPLNARHFVVSCFQKMVAGSENALL